MIAERLPEIVNLSAELVKDFTERKLIVENKKRPKVNVAAFKDAISKMNELWSLFLDSEDFYEGELILNAVCKMSDTTKQK